MTINVEELRHHLAWFADGCNVVAVDEAGQRFEIVEVGETNGGDVRLVVRVAAA